MEKVLICDTTLRDGEQSPDAGMTLEQKITLGKALIDLGVDVLEAGFAQGSPLDAEVIYQLSQSARTKDVIISSVARCCLADIDVAVKALEPALRQNKARIHLFVATSSAHLFNKLNKTPEQILHMIQENVRYARKFTKDVQWSAEDATRTDKDFLVQCTQRAIDAGATTINLADTVGQMVDTQMRDLFEYVIDKLNHPQGITFSAHCHNDKGLATANSLFALKGGARQLECCVNGLGERAGNAALEEIVMALKATPEIYPFTTRIETKKIMSVAQMVSDFSGFEIAPNKAIVGKNAFKHASGTHQDGVIKAEKEGIKAMYSAIIPELLDRQNEIVITRHSGSNALMYVFEKMGIEIQLDTAHKLLELIKEQTQHPKSFSPQELKDLYQKLMTL